MKNKHLIFPILALLLLGAACQKKTVQQNTQSTTTTNKVAQATEFPSGIYYRLPNRNDPSGVLTLVGGGLPMTVTMAPVGFDINAEQAVYPGDAGLVVVSPSGQTRSVTVSGLYQIGRPTMSPDESRVAVQATTKPHPAGETADPSELKIFVITLADGSWVQISPADTLPHESPRWFPNANRVAYSSFSPTAGVDIHIYDLDEKKETQVIQDAGWHGLAVSPDGTKIFIPNSMKIFSVVDGRLVADLDAGTRTAVPTTGLTLATSIGDSGSPFLSGSWSPDGTQIVFDAIILDQGEPRDAIFTMMSDGTNLDIVADPLGINPDFSNRHNFSQVDPRWL